MSDTKSTKDIIVEFVEAEKSKAPANQKPHWAKLVAHIKKHDLPAGQAVWIFDGKKVLAGTVREYTSALDEHNKGKTRQEQENPVAFIHSSQVTQYPDGEPLPHPSRLVPPTEKHVPAKGSRGQLAQWSCWNATGSHHNIDVKLRADPAQGGDPNQQFHYRPINDTGSDCQTVYRQDFGVLNLTSVQNTGIPIPTTHGVITTASANVPVEYVNLQVSVIAQTGDPRQPWKILMDWQLQNCVVMPGHVPCLSGDKMREHLWFCTPRGNQTLYVAENKSTLLKNMPATG